MEGVETGELEILDVLRPDLKHTPHDFFEREKNLLEEAAARNHLFQRLFVVFELREDSGVLHEIFAGNEGVVDVVEDLRPVVDGDIGEKGVPVGEEVGPSSVKNNQIE